GHDAVVRRGPAGVQAANCAFGPHAASFHLLEGGDGPDEAPPVVARHCSVLAAGGSAVFQVDADADAALDVKACLFSRPGTGGGMSGMGMGGADRQAVLVRQPAGRGLVTYRGSDNRYHNLDAFWAAGDVPEAAEWADF